MRRVFLTMYAVLVCGAMASCAIALANCAPTLETDRPAPSMNAIREHEWIVTTRPALQPFLDAELTARQEYYDSIGTTDARYAAAKKAMADAVEKMREASGGGK